ncbi:hypothetical protein V8F06_000060 [Rhypophila decipiens]
MRGRRQPQRSFSLPSFIVLGVRMRYADINLIFLSLCRLDGCWLWSCIRLVVTKLGNSSSCPSMLSVLFGRTLLVALLLLCYHLFQEPVLFRGKRPAATKPSSLPPEHIRPPQPRPFQFIPSPTRGLNCLAHTQTGHSSDTLV